MDDPLPPYFPSIFNDVIGPVMRGASSSHCAAALRIGRLIRDLMGGTPGQVTLRLDRQGSLATTYRSQGSEMGLVGGLLGFDVTDERLLRYRQEAERTRLTIDLQLSDLALENPNIYGFAFHTSDPFRSLVAVSTGGGMIEIREINGASVLIRGDAYETLVVLPKSGPIDPEGFRRALAGLQYCRWTEGTDERILQLTSAAPLDPEAIRKCLAGVETLAIRRLQPVLPVLSPGDLALPFTTAAGLSDYNRDRHLSLSQLAVIYEMERGGLSEADVRKMMVDRVRLWKESIRTGLAGTAYEDRILGPQAGGYEAVVKAGQMPNLGFLDKAIPYITALMEVKSAMGLIVAAPTAGSCGTLPGTVIAAAERLELDDEPIAEALLAGGLIGVLVSLKSTFAAEIAGCQAECGVASGMTAAALVTLSGGDTTTALAAASMALQNAMGMTCDPVAGRVEVPCLGKNIMAASNAAACANMSLAGYDPVIPLDEVIETLDRVGRSLPRELRCTALGGLSITSTSRSIAERLNTKEARC